MKQFPYAHATHPQWQMAVGLVLAQLRAQVALGQYASNPTLGILYITDHYASHAEDILALLSAEMPAVVDWAGTVGVGVASNNVEYFDEPALAVMLCELPANQYRVFSGVAPLGSGARFAAHSALVHADGDTADLADLVSEMAERTQSGYLFGGLCASRSRAVQFAVSSNGTVQGQGASNAVFSGGLSGVAFGPGVGMVSRVTQGCQPISKTFEVTRQDANVVLELNGEPALDVLLRELGVDLGNPQHALNAVRQTLVGVVDKQDHRASAGPVPRTNDFGSDVEVRHIIGLDPLRRGVAIAMQLKPGMTLAFCRRNMQAARMDLVRVCAEIREELDAVELPLTSAMAALVDEADAAAPKPRQIAGAIYVSCSGRGGPHFGGPNAEMQIVRKALGDVSLVGFFAGGEIAHHHLYGYTGVLTVFTSGG